MSRQVTAPMPGKIVQVLATIGKDVTLHEQMFVMEAMKMEMPIVAPQAGKVLEVHVTEGQAVQKNALLAVIE